MHKAGDADSRAELVNDRIRVDSGSSAWLSSVTPRNLGVVRVTV